MGACTVLSHLPAVLRGHVSTRPVTCSTIVARSRWVTQPKAWGGGDLLDPRFFQS